MGAQHLREGKPLLHGEQASLCCMEGNRNCFPSPTKGDNMAAPSEALLRLFPFRFLEHTELKSWVLEVHGILAQTVVFSSSPWFGLSLEPPLG